MFREVVWFEEERLAGHLVSNFCSDLALRWCAYGKWATEPCLVDHEGMGAHTDVTVLSGRTRSKYTWSHLELRPFGRPLPWQCPRCKRVGCLERRQVPLNEAKGKDKGPADAWAVDVGCRGVDCWYKERHIMPEAGVWAAARTHVGRSKGAWIITKFS